MKSFSRTWNSPCHEDRDTPKSFQSESSLAPVNEKVVPGSYLEFLHSLIESTSRQNPIELHALPSIYLINAAFLNLDPWELFLFKFSYWFTITLQVLLHHLASDLRSLLLDGKVLHMDVLKAVYVQAQFIQQHRSSVEFWLCSSIATSGKGSKIPLQPAVVCMQFSSVQLGLYFISSILVSCSIIWD